jgi:hypothetical protein
LTSTADLLVRTRAIQMSFFDPRTPFMLPTPFRQPLSQSIPTLPHAFTARGTPQYSFGSIFRPNTFHLPTGPRVAAFYQQFNTVLDPYESARAVLVNALQISIDRLRYRVQRTSLLNDISTAQVQDPDVVLRLQKLLLELDQVYVVDEYLIQGVSKKQTSFLNREETLRRLNLQDARDLEQSERLASNFDDAITSSQLTPSQALTQAETSLRYFTGLGINDFARLLSAGDRGLLFLTNETDED